MKLAEKIADASGALARADQANFERLEFDFEGMSLHAESVNKSGAGEIIVTATLGRLYFTIENANNRILAIERIRSTNRGIDGAYRIDRDGTVHFECRTATDNHVTGDKLMSALTLIVLEAEPHLRAIHSNLKQV